MLVSIRRKQSEISRQKFDIGGICIRSPMRDLTSTDSVHHSERSARGAIPYWSLAKIHTFMDLTLMQLRALRAVNRGGNCRGPERRWVVGRLARGAEGPDTI